MWERHRRYAGDGRPLEPIVTGGQRNDGAALETVLADIRIPQWRALATRYDKPSIICRAAVVLFAGVTWTRI